MLERDRKTCKVTMNKPFESNHRSMSNLIRLRNKRRNSVLMTRHYPDLSSASDCLKQISHAARRIRSTTHIRVLTRLKYGISALVSQTSVRGETSRSVTRCRLFSRANEFWSECKDEFLHYETTAFKRVSLRMKSSLKLSLIVISKSQRFLLGTNEWKR